MIVVKLNDIIVIYAWLLLEYMDYNDFLTNFYHSLHLTGNIFLIRLHGKLSPEHPLSPNIGCPMSPPIYAIFWRTKGGISKVVLGLQNFGYYFWGVGGDVWTYGRKISAHAHGGTSEGSSVRRQWVRTHIGMSENLFFFFFFFLIPLKFVENLSWDWLSSLRFWKL